MLNSWNVTYCLSYRERLARSPLFWLYRVNSCSQVYTSVCWFMWSSFNSNTVTNVATASNIISLTCGYSIRCCYRIDVTPASDVVPKCLYNNRCCYSNMSCYSIRCCYSNRCCSKMLMLLQWQVWLQPVYTSTWSCLEKNECYIGNIPTCSLILDVARSNFFNLQLRH